MRPVGSHPPRELCRIDSDIWGGLKPAHQLAWNKKKICIFAPHSESKSSRKGLVVILGRYVLGFYCCLLPLKRLKFIWVKDPSPRVELQRTVKNVFKIALNIVFFHVIVKVLTLPWYNTIYKKEYGVVFAFI